MMHNHKLIGKTISIDQTFYLNHTDIDHIVSFPYTPSEGTLMYIFGSYDLASPAPAVPSGWTQIANVNITAEPATYLWTKIAGASESNSYNFSSYMPCGAHMIGLTFNKYRIGSPHGPIVTSTSGSGIGANLVTGNFNPDAGSLIILFYSKGSGAPSVSFTNNFLPLVGGPATGLRQKFYESAATGENSTITWGTATNRNRSMILEMLPII